MHNFRASQKIRRDNFGESHAAVAETWYQMGCTLVLEENYEYAVKCLKKAVSIQKDECGLESKELGDSQHMLGYSHIKVGDYKEALSALQESLKIRKQTDDEVGVSQTVYYIATATDLSLNDF